MALATKWANTHFPKPTLIFFKVLGLAAILNLSLLKWNICIPAHIFIIKFVLHGISYKMSYHSSSYTNFEFLSIGHGGHFEFKPVTKDAQRCQRGIRLIFKLDMFVDQNQQ